MKKAMVQIEILIILIAGLMMASVFVAHFMLNMRTTGEENKVTADIILDKTTTSLDINTVVTKGNDQSRVDTLIITVENRGQHPVAADDILIYVNQRNTSSVLQYRNGTLYQDPDNGFFTE